MKYSGMDAMDYVEDPITHKRIVNNGQKDKYMLRDGHPAIVSRELFDRVQRIMDSHIVDFKIKRIDTSMYTTSYTKFGHCPHCGSNYFLKLNRQTATFKRMLYCHSNQSRKLCPESESVYVDDLDKIIPLQIKILRKNLPQFRMALIDAFSNDRKPAIRTEIEKLDNKIAEVRATLKTIVDCTELSVQQLCEHYRYEIKKASREKLKLENEILTLVDPEVRAKTIIDLLKQFPDDESIGGYDFRKLLVKVVIYSRNNLVFIIGSGDMTKLPKKITPLFNGTYKYKVRCSTYVCKFGIYINN